MTLDDIERLAWSAYWADDLRQAFRLFLRLAMSGVAVAQFQVGCMFDQGQGVRPDAVLAARWYRTAAQQGHAPAQHQLALLYERGRGVPRDRRRAVHWLRLAAGQGFDPALIHLAVLLSHTVQEVEAPCGNA